MTEPETHFENVALRRSRPVELWREFAQAGLAAVFGAQDITLVFDQKAGCSRCPCSPGFFLVRNRRRQVVVTDGIVDFASVDRCTPRFDLTVNIEVRVTVPDELAEARAEAIAANPELAGLLPA